MSDTFDRVIIFDANSKTPAVIADTPLDDQLRDDESGPVRLRLTDAFTVTLDNGPVGPPEPTIRDASSGEGAAS